MIYLTGTPNHGQVYGQVTSPNYIYSNSGVKVKMSPKKKEAGVLEQKGNAGVKQ